MLRMRVRVRMMSLRLGLGLGLGMRVRSLLLSRHIEGLVLRLGLVDLLLLRIWTVNALATPSAASLLEEPGTTRLTGTAHYLGTGHTSLTSDGNGGSRAGMVNTARSRHGNLSIPGILGTLDPITWGEESVETLDKLRMSGEQSRNPINNSRRIDATVCQHCISKLHTYR